MGKQKICIIGGGGHVGFPLGLYLASKNFNISLYEKNLDVCKKINNGKAPYFELGAKKIISKFRKNFIAGYDNKFIKEADIIIVCIGTPVDNELKPDFKTFLKFFYFLKKIIKKNQIVLIRSSVYPGVTNKIKNILKGKNSNLVYCPERILQGRSLIELPNLPQIISAYNKKSLKISTRFFKNITKKIIVTSILEAELIKLFSNAWRYINFATSNQFYTICNDFDVDFNSIRKSMMDGYGRNSNMPFAGFAAGPCLLKDTMQLSHFVNNKFTLGNASLKINEGLPIYIVKDLEKKFNLRRKTIGILGLAFKSDVDDTRDSLSKKLIKILKQKKYKYIISDEYVKDKNIVSSKKLINMSDIIIVAVPHTNYKKLKIPKNKYKIDTWEITT
jgi:UDP-N-acetyl-D-mannosaminuronic acid dehydrogenase